MLSFLKTCEAVMADSSCWEAQQLLLVKLLLCLCLQVRVTRGKPGKQTILFEKKNILGAFDKSKAFNEIKCGEQA